MINYDGDLREIRKHLYKQFGSGSGSNIHEKELEFDRGMPEKGKAAFPLVKVKATRVKEIVFQQDGWYCRETDDVYLLSRVEAGPNRPRAC